MLDTMNELFSVCQFFMDDSYEYVRRHVTLEKATEAFKFYTTNVASRIGTTTRVIITDGGDCICAEWEYGKGLVFPKDGEKS
jgi:hypothetical protein